jgi:acyl-CoA synthetase (AMP-forming)/AMP-acid ligase II
MLYSLLEKSAENHPDSIAIWSYNYSCTYFELNEKVKILSNGLLKKGLKKGDRIASYLYNCPEAIQLYFACFKIGVSVVVIHPFFREFEIRLMVETAQPKLFITQLELYENIQKLTGQFSSIIKCYYLIDCLHNSESNVLPFADLINQNYQVEQDIEVTGDQEATIFLTSGTTGKSKCVQSNHYQKICNVEDLKSLRFDHNDKFLLTTSMNSSTGLNICILPPIRYGSTICYLPNNIPINVFIKMLPLVLYEHNITCVFCVSSTLRKLVEEIKVYTGGEYRKHLFRYFFFGGEKFSQSSYEKARKCLGFYPTEVYGMTETDGFFAIAPGNSTKCGQYKPFGKTTKFRITNDNWEDMPYNTSGEITVYSNRIMNGYLNDEKTTQKIIKNGWIKTGDIGYLDPNGILNFVGRTKQIVICNGGNVNLLEVEETLLECNDVYEVCATSIPYMQSEKPVAYVTLYASCLMNITEIEIHLFSYLKEKLAEFKIPLYIRILDALPKNSIGKIDRKILGERALQEFVQN